MKLIYAIGFYSAVFGIENKGFQTFHASVAFAIHSPFTEALKIMQLH